MAQAHSIAALSRFLNRCQQLIRAAKARGFGVVGMVKRNRCVNGHKVEQLETGEVVRLRGADFLL